MFQIDINIELHHRTSCGFCLWISCITPDFLPSVALPDKVFTGMSSVLQCVVTSAGMAGWGLGGVIIFLLN